MYLWPIIAPDAKNQPATVIEPAGLPEFSELMNTAFLSLGSNEGDRPGWLTRAVRLLGAHCGAVKAISPVYETAAWGITDQPDFLNQALELHTLLNPHDLLAAVLNIELIMGRHRTVKWGPRTIDIDILLYNNEVLNSPDLIIPHPYLQHRRFILAPLADVAPAYTHPVLNRTIQQLLDACTDHLDVHRYD